MFAQSWEGDEMKNITKMWLCILGIILSTQIQWIIPDAELFNGLALLFGIGFGWYAKCSQTTRKVKA